MLYRSLRGLTVPFLLTVLFATPATAGAEAAVPRSRLIALDSHAIDIEAPLESLAADLLLGDAAAAASPYALVKFADPVSAEQLAELSAATERIYAYLPQDAFLVRLKAGTSSGDLERRVGLSWAGPYQPGYKISSAVQRATAETLENVVSQAQMIVLVQGFPDGNLADLRRQLEALPGAHVVGVDQANRFSRVRLLVPQARLRAFAEGAARVPETFWIDLEPRRVLLNDTTVWVSQSGLSGGNQTPIFSQGIHGEGQVVGILDTGIDADMCYFRDPARGLPPRNECNGGTVTDPLQRKVIAVDFLWSNECSGGISNSEWDTQDHGTHVAGTVAGDDLLNPIAHDPGDGMAPGAKLVIQDCGYQVDNCADCPGIGCPVVDLNPIFQQAYNQSARIHTNSWGDAENDPNKGRYTAGSQDADEFMWNHKDFLLLFAAGNDGPGVGSVGSPSTAKSVVSVGATLRASSANSMASFSSCGPTLDGRIKPDITMPGSGIISANADQNVTSNNCGTKSSSGTSMASPGAAGSAALIRQYFTEGWYPSGAPVPADAFTPTAALVKATLVHSGTNMTNTPSIPGGCQGWGRVFLDSALHFSGESREIFVEDDTVGFASGSSGVERTYALTVGSSAEPLKVSLVWTDFPSTPAASTHLINDLDLQVSGPSGTFRGNVFSGGASTTGGNFDRLNTVEQVLLANPAVGNYTVTVRAFTVPSGPQPFALVASGALTPACSPAPVANAGPDQTIALGASAVLGTAAQAGHSYSWSPGGQTTAQITVSPTATTTYTVTATTACGSAMDSAQVTVLSGSCAADHDFSSGAGGWFNDGASTCSTGSFVVGTPTEVINGGVRTQPAGDHTTGNGNAYFSAVNTSAGVNDVDGGNCIVRSPVIAVPQASDLSIWYFHGQRDTGGDATGDFFRLELSTNGGSTWSTLASVGDVTSSATWTEATASIPAGANVQLRLQVSDGTASGDLIEAGVDDLSICAVGGGGNTPPVVTISAPASGTSVPAGSSVTFTGSATDTQDGNLSASLSWSSNLDGAIGSGASFSTTALSVGAHTVTAAVTDSGGLSGSAVVSVTVTAVSACTVDDGFESGTAGWSNSASSTCTTGAFVVGTPSQQTSTVVTQVGGDHTTGSGKALYTAANSSAGVDDVDGGNCILDSPTWNVPAASTLTVWYFHGQRDTGDDASGDFFRLQVSTNGGSSYTNAVSIGDVRTVAAWTQATFAIPAGSNVKVRVQASDGAGPGDIVEGGIDDLKICPN